jgi:hypothetical protein
MEGEWPFLYSFDKEIARAAGCYEAEDGEEWDGTVCIVINKVGTLCRFFNCIHLKMQLKKQLHFFRQALMAPAAGQDTRLTLKTKKICGST